MEADVCALYPSLCHCSILLVFKATATQVREKSEQTLESLRIELGTSSTEGSSVTCLLCGRGSFSVAELALIVDLDLNVHQF